MNGIDLRSDCVTLPSFIMRQAMYDAPLGDDVFGEAPTVNRLESVAAERIGKEAALFVPSGTRGNLAAMLTHCQRGHEAIMGDQAHKFLFEAGGAAVLGGIHPHAIPNQPDGTLHLDAIEAAIRSEDVHHPHTRIICLENTHNLIASGQPAAQRPAPIANTNTTAKGAIPGSLCAFTPASSVSRSWARRLPAGF